MAGHHVCHHHLVVQSSKNRSSVQAECDKRNFLKKNNKKKTLTFPQTNIHAGMLHSSLHNNLTHIHVNTHSPGGSLCVHLLPSSLNILFYFRKGMAFLFIFSLSMLRWMDWAIVLYQEEPSLFESVPKSCFSFWLFKEVAHIFSIRAQWKTYEQHFIHGSLNSLNRLTGYQSKHLLHWICAILKQF